MFWKKKPKPEPELIPVPKEHVKEILELLDIHYAAERKQDHISRYNLWTRIEEVCKLDPTKKYSIRVNNILHPVIEETIE